MYIGQSFDWQAYKDLFNTAPHLSQHMYDPPTFFPLLQGTEKTEKLDSFSIYSPF